MRGAGMGRRLSIQMLQLHLQSNSLSFVAFVAWIPCKAGVMRSLIPITRQDISALFKESGTKSMECISKRSKGNLSHSKDKPLLDYHSASALLPMFKVPLLERHNRSRDTVETSPTPEKLSFGLSDWQDGILKVPSIPYYLAKGHKRLVQ